jgi:hypothetical protein
MNNAFAFAMSIIERLGNRLKKADNLLFPNS